LVRSLAIETVVPPPSISPAALDEKLCEESSSSTTRSELVEFIRGTMLKSVKDRNIILRIEADLIQLVKEKE